MPNTGKPSRGCYTCRARRIKCDRGEPQCQKCKNLGRPCPGYRDEASMVFHNQNNYARTMVLSRPSRALDTNSLVKSTYTDQRLILPPSLSLNFETQAIDQFYSQYVMAEGRSGYGYLDFLPEMATNLEYSPCLQGALSATALANASKQRRQPEILPLAREKYGQALALMKKAIRNPQRAASDDVQLTILCFSIYEIILGECWTRDYWDSHFDGRMTILRLRKHESFTERSSINMFRVMHFQILLGCLLRKIHPPEDAIRWIEMGDPSGAVERMTKLVVEVTRLGANTREIVTAHQDQESQDELHNLIEQGRSLDSAFEHWASTIHALWKYTSFFSNSSGHNFPRNLHVYEDIFVAGTWIFWRSARIRLLQILIESAEWLAEHGNGPLADCYNDWQTRIMDLTHDICAAIPFILGEIDCHENSNTYLAA
ncbi:MAG: hypothetical protein M1820_007902 [Bogoriella megaspora]|nr:MAG: hypothetical protein M1820_007902 [Bogoriella megaspora]